MVPALTIKRHARITSSGSIPDEVLVAAAIGGDEEAFGALASRHRATALRTAAKIVGMNGAEDVVQDALLLAFRSLSSIGDRSKFSRWLSTITRFRALRVERFESRRRARTVCMDEKELETISSLAFAPRREEDGDELLLEALERIPPRYAEVMRLHFLHGLPHKSIAVFVDAPLATVRWRCFRGKELLRDALKAGGSGTARIEEACRRCVEERLAEKCPGVCPGKPSLARAQAPTCLPARSGCLDVSGLRGETQT